MDSWCFDNSFYAEKVTFDHFQYLQATIKIKKEVGGHDSTLELSIPHTYVVAVFGQSDYKKFQGFLKKNPSTNQQKYNPVHHNIKIKKVKPQKASDD